MIRVAVNGYGVIGRRVADAVAAQRDMTLLGVIKVKPDYKARLALSKGYKVYASDEKALQAFADAKIQASGTGDKLLKEADIVVDACPDGVGAANRPRYEALALRAIFEGGEEHEVAGFSFVAQCNFDEAVGRRFVRVVSCNTTALCRVLHALDAEFGIERARVVIARRAADPDETGKGPIDAVSLDPVHIPSHHGPDVATVLPHLKVVSMALKVPTTHMHLHSINATLKDRTATEDRIVDALNSTTRLMLVSSKEGFTSTAHAVDYARELKRPRNDLYEAIIWEDSVTVDDGETYLYMGVHQEAIVVPENIDAIRALAADIPKAESIRLTNESLGILR